MIRAFLALPALALTAGLAMAQTETTEAPAAGTQMDMGMAYESARNQLGVLEYCQTEGHIDGKAVEIQTKLLTLLPEGDKAKGDAAQEKGKTGTVSSMGMEQTLDAAATAQNSSVEALCKQMDTMIQQLAAQLPS
ncbi:pore-forming ESAT-6 family protein [Paracoccus cavernae]|uniref:Pore-forming ESAT-6 family protein n=1 Tax=Paracoccus cavernae TaxID=1571207 RepID=A0ABT8D4V4_9RHOB|nr:pore-forming ESAT-6 family protein [Paracoccus cavernae]